MEEPMVLWFYGFIYIYEDTVDVVDPVADTASSESESESE